MDIRKIKNLIKLIKESDISELHISEGDKSVRIIRSSRQFSCSMMQQAYMSSIQQQKMATVIPTSVVEETATVSVNSSHHIVRSPMVGTFYRTPSPDEKPFIEIGQKVNTGDTLCIIEAMKMMNQIESDTTGVIKDILIENGHPVEFDEPLVIIE